MRLFENYSIPKSFESFARKIFFAFQFWIFVFFNLYFVSFDDELNGEYVTKTVKSTIEGVMRKEKENKSAPD